MFLLVALVTVFFVWSINHLEGFQWDADEGINVMKGWLVQLGYPLYTQTWADQPPAFPVILAIAFNLLGRSVEVARTVTVVHACLGLIAVAWLIWELEGNWMGAMIGPAMLILAPNFFWASRAAMIGLPSVSLAMLAMAAMFAYFNTGERRWLVLGGFIFSASLLEKLVVPYVLVPMGLLILLRPDWTDRRTALRRVLLDLGLLAGMIIGAVLATCLVVDGRAMVEQVIGTYLSARGTYPLDLDFNLDRTWRYLTLDNLGLLGVSVFGGLLLAGQRARRGFIIVVWVAVTAVAIITHTPIWSKHHFLPLLYLMAVISGYAVGWLAEHLARFQHLSNARRLVLLAGLAVVAFYAVDLDWVLRVDRELLSVHSDDLNRRRRLPDPVSFLADEEAVRFLQDVTQPGDFIVTDDPMIAFRAGRRVPPPLNVTSRKRVDTGGLRVADIVAVTQAYKPAAILLWDNKLSQYSGFVSWMKHRYTLDQEFGLDRQVWVPNRLVPNIQHPLHVILGDQIQLLGYNLWASEVKSGGLVQMMLFWQTPNPLPADYTVFVHLVRDGTVWAQVDSQPVADSYPTSWWMPGEVILDQRIIKLPDNTPPGRYDLVAGMYDPTTLRRLQVAGCGTGTSSCVDDAVTLTTIEVTS
jgi:hypothetical protein